VILASRLRTLGLLALAGACVVAACSTTTATTAYTPITGIEIKSAALVAGFGCGTGDTQVYRYAAVVSFAPVAGTEAGADAGAREDAGKGADAGVDASPEADASPGVGAVVQQSGVPLTNIFECYSDGVFENLPTSDAGSLTFTVTIFAYNFRSYYEPPSLPADLACPPLPEGGFCAPGTEPLSTAQEGRAPWITSCTATQQAGTPVIAVCPPLQPTAAPVEGPDASADAAPDSATGAPPDSGTDASPGAEPDAAPDATMTAPDGATTTPPDASVDGAAPADLDGAPADAGAPSNDG
jgi:hypothetical protein